MNMHNPPSGVYAPQPLLLSSFSALRREPTRPLANRGPDFDAKFDFDTLFFDAFRRVDGKAMLIGPPLLNLRPIFERMTVRSLPSGTLCSFHFFEMDRHARVIVDAPTDDHTLQIKTEAGQFEIAVGDSLAGIFAGRRVLLTQSRNNQLHWITEWARFARDRHGADAVLIYDNRSTHYGIADLSAALSEIKGVLVKVVDWPAMFGPQGIDSSRFWDSDFGQLGAWEHARWRFLAKAKSVQAGDVDELLLSRSGESVFDATEKSPFGVLRYRGRWIMGTSESTKAEADPSRSFRDYSTVLKVQPRRRFGIFPVDGAACMPKWSVVPARTPERAQWGIHSIAGWLPSKLLTARFSFRHFRELTSNWKYDRNGRVPFDPKLHETDTQLQRELALVSAV